jgi:hypothetical protein
LPGEISNPAASKRYQRSSRGGRRVFAAIHNKRFVKANAGFVVFVLRQFCVENLLNKTLGASNLAAHGRRLFVLSHDLAPKVRNFFKITLLRESQHCGVSGACR